MTKFQLPKREQNSNKGTFGRVLNFAGSENYVGAAYLSSLGAYKIGAGFVAVSSQKNISNKVSILLPEAVLLNDTEALKQVNKFNVYIVGCGFGQNFFSKSRFKKIINRLKNTTKPVIVDADGLNIISSCKFSLPENLIITPHPAEAARLLKIKTEDVLADLEGSAMQLTNTYKCITVLKTHRTIVCSKDKKIYINEYGNSALAKAGTGDVLAGIIAGLIAQSLTPFEAAKLGVYMHSRAGEIASETLTEYSVLASEITEYLPKVFKELINQ